MIAGEWRDDPTPAVASMAERALLGACMIRGRLDAVPPELRLEDFAGEQNRAIYRVMLGLEADELPVDTVTVRERTLSSLPPGMVGLTALIGMIDMVPSPDEEGIRGYARIVMESAAKRLRLCWAS